MTAPEQSLVTAQQKKGNSWGKKGKGWGKQRGWGKQKGAAKQKGKGPQCFDRCMAKHGSSSNMAGPSCSARCK